MAIQVQGQGGVVAEVDGSTYRALRTTPRPTEYGALGHYRISTIVPLLVTQVANGILFSWHWGSATNIAVLEYLRLSCIQTAAATATIVPHFQAFITRTFTVADSAGTLLTLTTNQGKRRTNMSTMAADNVRISAVAAGVTAGTGTDDAKPILDLPTNQTITTPNATQYEALLGDDVASGAHPQVFTQNEGLRVRGPTTVFGAAGTADLVVEIGWAELASY